MSISSSFDMGVLALLLIWSVIGLAFLLWAIGRHRIIIQLWKQGRITKGKVVDLGIDWSSRGLTLCHVHYQFYIQSNDSNNGRWDASQMVSPSHYDRLKIGDEVRVCYLPSNPVVSRLAGRDLDHASRDIALEMVVIILVASVIFIIDMRGNR